MGKPNTVSPPTVYSVVIEKVQNNIDMRPDFNTLLHKGSHSYTLKHTNMCIDTNTYTFANAEKKTRS